MAVQYEHLDKMGRLLEVGDCVAVADHNSLRVAKIKKFSAKMVQISWVPATKWGGSKSKYSHDMVKLDGPEVTVYLLKNL